MDGAQRATQSDGQSDKGWTDGRFACHIHVGQRPLQSVVGDEEMFTIVGRPPRRQAVS